MADSGKDIPAVIREVPQNRITCRSCMAVVQGLNEISDRDPALCRRCAGELAPSRRVQMPFGPTITTGYPVRPFRMEREEPVRRPALWRGTTQEGKQRED